MEVAKTDTINKNMFSTKASCDLHIIDIRHTHILDYIFHFDDYCYLTVSKKRFDQNLHVYQNSNHTLLGIL